ncbi:MAG: hypothetical protein ACP5P2_01470 [Candidatus Micrarchaeia archaeon]|jgi:hypothetical protein
MRLYKPLLVFLFFAIVPSIFGFSISSLISPGSCQQVNSSYIICPDGVPIKISFAISAPYTPPYLGNFTVYPIQYWNVSEVMNAYETGKCVVGWSSTSVCILYLSPISPFLWNGVVKRSIPLQLVSNIYPQVVYNRSLNITIEHYITGDEATLLVYYNKTYARLASIKSSYSYFCDIYNICSPSLWYNISLASNALNAAIVQLNSSRLYASYLNITSANSTINSLYPSFQIFLNNSNNIVNNIIKARYLLANITSNYYMNKERLENCTFPNGTNYAAYLNNSINILSKYPSLNTLNSSLSYLSLIERLKENETRLINLCHRPSFSISLSKEASFKYMLYLFSGIAIILAAYAMLRLKEAREVKRMRHEYSKESTPNEREGNIGIKEVEEAEEGTTEGYFDRWLSNAIGEQKEIKKKKGKK